MEAAFDASAFRLHIRGFVLVLPSARARRDVSVRHVPAFGAVFAAYDITKAYRRHKFFEELHRRNTELISALPEPEGIVDSDYQQLISVLKEK